MTSPTTPATTPQSSMPVTPAQTGTAAPATFVERLANQMGLRVGATTIVGAPIERDGVTVVPMARASWGFGGGGGSGGEGQQRGEGTGGGGGANVRPVGYIEIKNGQATFRPMVDPNTVLQIALMFAGTFAVLAGLRAVRRILAGK